ncbi:WxL domain-containing protein [Enterococcus casseliflavus]|uniref:WxL domain-containing protein n=1 Tax=Enterococcus casseliflavus TaxID=37734 RepID=UPI00232AA0F0|nr:WxL domain-containing protein [Enterococcus casseliflavus]MDB1693597.1 WxL domain-containing protein [Enterococcus casseliflavus]MDB1697634.1 WxL domain-containing protein [Enterococcus casseliflavus]MDB1700965.1 WxL domain-containing protein [Enterococcus casseliflavus]MDB1705307.1 WxL domain-containing protein [Enterococcus casseliflavus]
MKWIRLATVATLTSTIFAGGVQAVANDEPRTPLFEVETPNEVTFTQGEEDIDDVENPLEYPPVIIDPLPVKGPLTIVYVPEKFDFGQQAITSSAAEYSLIAEMQNVDENHPLAVGLPDTVPYVSLAQVSDTRGNSAADWTLSLALTEFVGQDTGDILYGAQLHFIDPQIKHNDGTGPAEEAPVAPVTETGGDRVILNANTDLASSIPVMTAGPNQGQGRSSVFWGDQDKMMNEFEGNDFTGTILNDRIQLHLPSAATPQQDTYTATLTWTLSTTVSADGENGGNGGDEDDNDLNPEE